jgi:hypothetical protein
MKNWVKNLKLSGELGFAAVKFITIIKRFFSEKRFLSDRMYISRRFKRDQGYDINWDNPTTLNEKLQLLKSVYKDNIHSIVSDKFLCREFIKERFGESYLIPLAFETKNPKEITDENIPNYPVIVKSNHDAGNHVIIRDKRHVNWKKLQLKCKWWLSWNYYNSDRELQYKRIERRIIVEKLLLTNEGKIPNDYKLNFINGDLQFIYVASDRETGNYRDIFDGNWNTLNYKWAKTHKLMKTKVSRDLAAPKTLELMKEMGAEIAKLFPYVRVDFYDVDGKLYFGEITLCHGGGFDRFEPKSFDYFYGAILNI